MKSLVISVVNLVWNPILYIKFSRWSRRLSVISNKRKQYILLSTNYTAIGFTLDIKLLIAQLAAFVFELDAYIDTVLDKTDNFKQTALRLTQSDHFQALILSISNKFAGLESVIEASTNHLLNEDMLALESDSKESYLQHSYASIGLQPIIDALSYTTKMSVDTDLSKNCGLFIRLLSDIATVEKDKVEGGKNIVQFVSKEEAEIELITVKNRLQAYKAQNNAEKFLLRLTKIMSKLYKPGKDFQL